MRTIILHNHNGSSSLFPEGEKLIPQRDINLLRNRNQEEFKNPQEQIRRLNLARITSDPIAYFPSIKLKDIPCCVLDSRKIERMEMRDPRDSWS